MNEKQGRGVVSNIKALSARRVDSIVGCGGGGFFCFLFFFGLVWIQRCDIWCRQYVGPATIYDRYERCASEVLCTMESHEGCERDSGGWVRILGTCS
jgi:hypothetical protein